MGPTKVCLIGAGPCGMSVLYHFAKQGGDLEVKCFEKQGDWGGLWNCTWQTGTDEYGDLCHGSMYKHLWANSPKEVIEFPDYTFEEHFGKPLPSFAPRPAIRDYMEARFSRTEKNLKSFIKFNTVVRNVEYREKTNDFLVTAYDRKADVTFSEVFAYVIVASGIFSVPNKPTFPGIDEFHGLVLHSHDFREAKAFSGLRVLVVGSSYSGEDVSIQCKKYGAKKVICTWKTQPMNYKFPEGVEERPLVERFDGKMAYFKDGSEAEIDCVILCTGYFYSHPFLKDSLQPKGRQSIFPGGLYKGIVWTNGANNKLLYIGHQDHYFSFTMFESQAVWIIKYIKGELDGEPKGKSEMEDDVRIWTERLAKINPAGDDGVDHSADYILDLNKMTGFKNQIDERCVHVKRWLHNRADNISTYRDERFTSAVTGKLAPPLKAKWINILEDSLEYYLDSADTTA